MQSLKTIMTEYLRQQIKFLLAQEKLSKVEGRHLDWMADRYFNLKYPVKNEAVLPIDI